MACAPGASCRTMFMSCSKSMQCPWSEIVGSWKKYTAVKANRLVRRRGRLWEADYWDTFMRDGAHERTTVAYIENNPTKAFLVRAPKDWVWSSARFRDPFGVLVF